MAHGYGVNGFCKRVLNIWKCSSDWHEYNGFNERILSITT